VDPGNPTILLEAEVAMEATEVTAVMVSTTNMEVFDHTGLTTGTAILSATQVVAAVAVALEDQEMKVEEPIRNSRDTIKEKQDTRGDLPST